MREKGVSGKDSEGHRKTDRGWGGGDKDKDIWKDVVHANLYNTKELHEKLRVF